VPFKQQRGRQRELHRRVCASVQIIKNSQSLAKLGQHGRAQPFGRRARGFTYSGFRLEGGSWTAASVSHAIARTSDEVRGELLRLAQKIPSSPLAGANPDDVILVDGKIASKKQASEAVSIANVMRHGKIDRIERQATTNFKDTSSHARNTHSAIFAEVKVDEEPGKRIRDLPITLDKLQR